MPMRLPAPAWFVVAAALIVAGCSSEGSVAPADSSPVNAAPTVAATDLASTTTATEVTEPPITALPGTDAPVTEPAATEAPTTEQPPTEPPATEPPFVERRTLGESVEGRPIIAERRGTPGGRVVLVIGVIHGDENDGLAIMDQLHQLPVPDGVDLWLVDSMNPDGVFHDVRQNADQVDLNRNFPDNWGPIGVPGDGEYAGPSAASEPETQAMVDFISEIHPDITLWYHQNLNRIAPGRGRDGAIRDRYSQLTGVPIINITGGTYTGVAATWARNLLKPGVAFIVELGDSVSDTEALVHANAILTITAEDD